MQLSDLIELYMDALLASRTHVQFFAPLDDPICIQLSQRANNDGPVTVVGRRDNGEWIVRMDLDELRRVIDQAKQAIKVEAKHSS